MNAAAGDYQQLRPTDGAAENSNPSLDTRELITIFPLCSLLNNV